VFTSQHVATTLALVTCPLTKFSLSFITLNKFKTRLAQRVQTSASASNLKPKVIRRSNSINLDSDPEVCRIAAKMLWIHYLSASVISLTVVKSTGDRMRKCW